MPLSAIYKEERLDAPFMSSNDWKQLKASPEKKELICRDPDCRSTMIPKTISRTGTQFFAHKANSTSENCAFGARESVKHLQLKTVVAEAIGESDWTPQIEHIIKQEGTHPKAIVDALAIPPSYLDRNPVAFEIQLSSQSEERYEERTNRYTAANFETCWFTPKILYNCEVTRFTLHELEDEWFAALSPSPLNEERFEIQTCVSEFLSRNWYYAIDECRFNSYTHWCIGLECAMDEGNRQNSSREASIFSAVEEIRKQDKDRRREAHYQKQARQREFQRMFSVDQILTGRDALRKVYKPEAWKALCRIAQKHNLPDPSSVLDAALERCNLVHFSGNHYAMDNFLWNKTTNILKKEGRFPRIAPSRVVFNSILNAVLFFYPDEIEVHRATRVTAFNPNLQESARPKCFCDQSKWFYGFKWRRQKGRPISRIYAVFCKCGTKGAWIKRKAIPVGQLSKAVEK